MGHGQVTSDTLVDAAQRLLGRAGYAATSIDQIATAASVSKEQTLCNGRFPHTAHRDPDASTCSQYWY